MEEYDINIDNEINAYAIYLEYEILYQADLVPGTREFHRLENDHMDMIKKRVKLSITSRRGIKI